MEALTSSLPSTETSISRPTTPRSTTIFNANSAAWSIAAEISCAAFTRVIPTDDPSVAQPETARSADQPVRTAASARPYPCPPQTPAHPRPHTALPQVRSTLAPCRLRRTCHAGPETPHPRPRWAAPPRGPTEPESPRSGRAAAPRDRRISARPPAILLSGFPPTNARLSKSQSAPLHIFRDPARESPKQRKRARLRALPSARQKARRCANVFACSSQDFLPQSGEHQFNAQQRSSIV